MQDLTLEKELDIRIKQHKMTMLMARIARQYIENESKATVKLPMPQLQEQAVEVARQKTSQIMLSGLLEHAYTEAWEVLKEVIPDNYCTLQ